MESRHPPFASHPPTASAFIRHVAERYAATTLAVRGERRVTYREIDEASRTLAKGLLAMGAGKGTRVGLLVPNGPDWIVSWLAASRIGCLVALLNTYYRPRELTWVLRHADVQHLLTVDQHLGHDYLGRLETIAPGSRRTTRGRPPPVVSPVPAARSTRGVGALDPGWARSMTSCTPAPRSATICSPKSSPRSCRPTRW